VVVVVLAAWSMFFTVNETQYAIVTRFGDPVRPISEPGLKIKYPWPIDVAVYFDKRLLTLDKPGPDEPPKELLTLDKKNIEVASYTCWKIAEPQRFLETCGTREGAEAALGDIVYAELGKVLGQHELSALLSIDASELKLDDITEQIRSTCADQAGREYGVQLVDFRIKRIVFPEQNRSAVFERMRAERKRIATRYRSEGAEEAAKIRAQADRERTEIQAKAYRQAQEIEGRAEAEATRIYAEAFGKDTDFYEFLRTMESYKTSLTSKDTIFLDYESPYLRLLESGADEVQGSADDSK
jgi:membrane protease subunit HflC